MYMNTRDTYDKIIIGAGLYGFYAARYCGLRGEKVIVLEKDKEPFSRATYINQARIHMGYHYPRSYSTAIKSAHYFNRFCDDFAFCINKSFDKIYALGTRFNWTNAKEFERFCRAANIRCDKIDVQRYFKSNMCEGAYLTTEYTYDALKLKEFYLQELSRMPNVTLRYNCKPIQIEQNGDIWNVKTSNGNTLQSPYLLNATYAGINDIHNLLKLPSFSIKYEKCEIILCKVSEELRNLGITVMDGPFFSIMPFGMTGYHSLTSVTFTPHETCKRTLATFSCQNDSKGLCAPGDLYNCNECPAKPQSAYPYMSHLARKFLLDKYEFKYHQSLFSMKPILKASEIDDSRPTVIRKLSESPVLYTVLSGKINTVYDLDKIL